MRTNYQFLLNYLQARFADDDRGASLVEYGLLVALIALAAVAGMQVLGGQADESFSEVGTRLGDATE